MSRLIADSPEWMPALDHALSPRTGYTRAHWEAAADRMLTSARAHALHGGALLDFTPDRSSKLEDRLEGAACTSPECAVRSGCD